MSSIDGVVSEHIEKHWKQSDCMLCGANNWVMNGPFGLVPISVDQKGYVNGYRPAKTGSPVIAMVCYKCGYTLLIDYSVIIGRDP